MFKKLLIIFISLVASNLACAKDASYRYSEFESGTVPDDVPIFDENNDRHFMEEYEGKTILLVFWASWCSGCTIEMPSLDILAKDFRKLDFKIIPLSIDYAGIDAAKEFYKKYDLRHLPIMHDYKNALFKEMNITALPTSILIDKDGKLIGKFTGDIAWHNDEIRKILLDSIPNNPATPKNSHKDISLDHKVNNKNPKTGESKEEELDAKLKRQDVPDNMPAKGSSDHPLFPKGNNNINENENAKKTN